MANTAATSMTVHAIPAADLEQVYRHGSDVAGNRPVPWPNATGSPLRCCLRRATPDDEVVLVSYAPLRQRSPWREVGPVFIHAQPCAGYSENAGLPPELRHGPRVLRSYRADGSLDYAAIQTIDSGEDIEGALFKLLDTAGIHEVHVRALAEQCFTYLVRNAATSSDRAESGPSTGAAFDRSAVRASRNPFGVADVPDPDGDDVRDFARRVDLAGAVDGENAEAWHRSSEPGPASLQGMWSSRWNADGIDWQQGQGRLIVDGQRIYILFDWDDGSKLGLIEARHDGPDRLIGRYLNVSAPEITRPWVGRIVDSTRIDGEHSDGRIDFRR